MAGIEDYFPMPSYRPKQREVLLKCWELFESGKRLILLQAPVGFGKSAVNTALCRYYTPAIYTTPQLNLIDQILNDQYLSHYFVEIKGRDNYRCAKDMFLTPVRYGLCKREKGVIPDRCDWLRECPYYSQKIKALKAPIVLMSTAYFIVDAFQEPPNFSNRNLVVIDEGHFLSEHLTEHVSLEVSPKVLPKKVWSVHRHDPTNVMAILEDAEQLLEQYEQKDQLTDEEVREKEQLKEWIAKAKRFLETELVAEWVWKRQNGGVSAVPVYTRYFVEEMIWSRAERFLVSSATILKPELWVKENGADIAFSMKDIAFIDVGMIFPAERRRVIDMSVGSMRHDQQNETIDQLVMMLRFIIEQNKDKNIAVHIPSYKLANDIYYKLIEQTDVKVHLPQPENRDNVLQKWKEEGGVLLAVAYHEGQDWKYETCQVQVLVKTLYPDTTDPRIAKRIERKDFHWLMWIALVKCLQAYGRAIRAEDDYMEFYVLDEQFWELVRRMWKHVPAWFKEVVPKNRWPKTAISKAHYNNNNNNNNNKK